MTYGKFFFSFLIIIALTVSSGLNEKVLAQSREDILSSVGFGKIFSSDPDKDIRKVFKSADKYSDGYNTKKMKSIFEKTFVNNDGFDYEKFFKMFESAKINHKNGKHETAVKEITVNGNNATAFVSEKFNATVLDPLWEKPDEDCIFSSYADIYYYLTKIDNKWKITAADTISEYGTVFCGVARNVDIFLTAPDAVAENTKYTATLNVKAPAKIIPVASIQNDVITFPIKESEPIFRPVDENGILERVVTSNPDGKNEVVTVTVALTGAIKDGDKIIFKLIGNAVLMRRVNVFSKGKTGEHSAG